MPSCLSNSTLLRYLRKSDQQLDEVLFSFVSLNSPLGVVIWAVFLSEFFRNLPGALNTESSDVLILAVVSKNI